MKINVYKNISDVYLNNINTSKLLIGITMIMLNVGSKYVDFKFTKGQEKLLREGLAREILIFAIVFMGTRDIMYAILLTAAFVILSEFAFNEKSKYCVVPDRMKTITTMIDTNHDGIISPEEEAKALDTLNKAERNRKRDMQQKFSTYLTNATNNNFSSTL
jgi:hypothetical protein